MNNHDKKYVGFNMDYRLTISRISLLSSNIFFIKPQQLIDTIFSYKTSIHWRKIVSDWYT